MKDEKGKLFRKSLSRTDHIGSYLVNEGEQTVINTSRCPYARLHYNLRFEAIFVGMSKDWNGKLQKTAPCDVLCGFCQV